VVGGKESLLCELDFQISTTFTEYEIRMDGPLPNQTSKLVLKCKAEVLFFGNMDYMGSH
jgi:hypothetical protein